MFGMDPYRQQMLALTMAGMGGGMANTPRMAGWSAPFGGAARGLAQMMPYMMQMQQDQQAQQQDQAHRLALAKIYQQVAAAMPQDSSNPMMAAARAALASPDTADIGLKLAELTPPKQDLKQVYDPATHSMIWLPEGQAAGKSSELPISVQEELRRAGASNVSVKTEGPIPEGNRAIRDAQGNLLGYERVPGYHPTGEAKTLKDLQQNFARVNQSVDSYAKALDLNGEGPMLWMKDPAKAVDVNNAYNDLMLEAKELYNLGVLNGPDYSILTTILTPPTSPQTALLSKDDLKNQIGRIRTKLDAARASAEQIYGGNAPSSGDSKDISDLLAKPADQWTEEDRKRAEKALEEQP